MTEQLTFDKFVEELNARGIPYRNNDDGSLSFEKEEDIPKDLLDQLVRLDKDYDERTNT